VLSQTVDSVAPVKLDDRHYNAHFISQILEYRAREVLEYARDSLEKSGTATCSPAASFSPARVPPGAG
jgi:cell division protein FtsA